MQPLSTPFLRWEDLLAGLRDGENGAWEALLERTTAVFMGIAQPITRSRPLAEDVLQETWEALWRQQTSGSAVEADPVAFAAGLTRVVRGLAWSMARREGRGRVVPFDPAAARDEEPSGASRVIPLETKPDHADASDPGGVTMDRDVTLEAAFVRELCQGAGARTVDVAAFLGLSPRTVEAELVQATTHAFGPSAGPTEAMQGVPAITDEVRRHAEAWRGEPGATYRLVRTDEPETDLPLKAHVRYEAPSIYTLTPVGQSSLPWRVIRGVREELRDGAWEATEPGPQGDAGEAAWRGPFAPVRPDLADRLLTPGLMPLGEETTAQGVRLHVLSAPLGADPAFVHLWLDPGTGFPSRVETWTERGIRTLRALITEGAWVRPGGPI